MYLIDNQNIGGSFPSKGAIPILFGASLLSVLRIEWSECVLRCFEPVYLNFELN